MKIMVICYVLVLVLLQSSASIYGQAAKKSTRARSVVPPVQASENEKPDKLSADFKKQAWRALDALDRLIIFDKKADLDTEGEMRLTDASKAIDEAKYVASTDLDRYVLQALQMALVSKQIQVSCDVLNPLWKPASARYLQCTTEVLYYIAPEQLSEQAVAEAKARTCAVKPADGWWSENKK